MYTGSPDIEKEVRAIALEMLVRKASARLSVMTEITSSDCAGELEELHCLVAAVLVPKAIATESMTMLVGAVIDIHELSDSKTTPKS
jgi:hypothetical protein